MKKKHHLSSTGIIYSRISLKHLWGAVLQCATEIVEELPRSHHGSRTKVYQSNVETLVDDDVLIFYVPVKDVLSSQIEDSCHQLRNRKNFQFNEEQMNTSFHVISDPIPLSHAIFFNPCTYLSKDVASQGLIQPWLHINEFKKVQTISVFLHHHLEVTSIFKHLQNLQAHTGMNDGEQRTLILETNIS